MATFLNIRTTDAGQALLADVHTGAEELTITHVAFGNGLWDDADHSAMNMTALKNEIMRVAPSGGSQEGGEAEITCVLKNTDLETGFALTEIGVIAQRKDNTEVLYMADAVPSAQSTWVSSKDEYHVSIPVVLRVVCSSTSEVEIRVESSAPITSVELEDHNIDSTAHADIRQELTTHDHDSAYYTRAELDVFLEHNHHDHYYTKMQIDEIWTYRMPPGHIYALPFPPDELPQYHYYPNGEGLLKTSEAGKRLLSMSAAYKAAHRVTEDATHVFMPDVFDSNGDGFFPRFADGVYREVGSIQGDAIQNITGGFEVHDSSIGIFSGAFDEARIGQRFGSGGTEHTSTLGTTFDASRVVPTAHENRPKNYAFVPAIYLPPLGGA